MSFEILKMLINKSVGIQILFKDELKTSMIVEVGLLLDGGVKKILRADAVRDKQELLQLIENAINDTTD
jgi:hypothetical protein